MKSVVILFLTFFVSFSYAADHVNKDGVKVLEVMTGYAHQGLFFRISSEAPNPNSCPASSNDATILAVSPEVSNVNHVLSVLLAAHAMGATIDLQIYSSVCFQNWATIRRVKIK